MATIPNQSTGMRHVRKTLTFTGGSGAGLLDSAITVFELTGRVGIMRFTCWGTELTCAAPEATSLQLTNGENNAFAQGTALLDNMAAPGWLDFTSPDAASNQALGRWVDYPNDAQYFLLADDLVLTPLDDGGGANITGGTLTFDCWYFPITNDGALAGDDIDTELIAVINATVDQALADYDPPTHAELTTGLAAADDAVLSAISSLNDLSAAEVNAEVDAALADYDGPTKAEMDAGFAAVPTATDNADALLKRDWTSVTGEAARSVLNALRSLRNRVGISSGTVTVYKEDDTTSAWTAAATTDANADPITEVDPS